MDINGEEKLYDELVAQGCNLEPSNYLQRFLGVLNSLM